MLGSARRWREVYEFNRERIPDPDHVLAGMTLTFPKNAAQRRVSEATPEPSVAAPDERTYQVANGDTLYSIALSHLGSGPRWREIVELNGLQSEHVAAGTVLRLPK